MKPHGLSSGSLVMMTTWNWTMIIFILSTSHFITLCYFGVMIQNHHKQNTDGCWYIRMNNCFFQTAGSCWLHHRAQSFRSRVPAAAIWQVWWSKRSCLCRVSAVFSFRFSYSKDMLCFLLQDKDSALSPTELTNLFRVCPYMPWGDGVYVSVPTTAEGYISNHGYHCQWMWVSQSVGNDVVGLVACATYFVCVSHMCVISFPYEGFLHILTSTVVWSIWGT